MTRHELQDEYFEWLCDIVCQKRYHKQISYRKLLMYLHDTEFVYLIPMDRNRAKDGVGLRDHFISTIDYGSVSDIDGPCSVLEMMIALAIRCENFMDDPCIGNRTSQWFWSMVTSLGLGGVTDERFDMYYVDEVLERFLKRDYAPNGAGGLFTIRNCDCDMRDIEIWHQMCRYSATVM